MVQAGVEHHIHPGHRISLSAKAAPSAAVGGAGTRSISSEPDELAIVLDRRTANRCCPRHRQRNADRLTAGPHKEISWSGRLGSGSRTANPVLVDHSSRSHCIGTDFFVRADGVDAATCGNGDFGTSPFYGQTQMSDARNSASRHATITAPFPKTQPTSTSAGMLFFWTTNWVPMPYLLRRRVQFFSGCTVTAACPPPTLIPGKSRICDLNITVQRTRHVDQP
jgi:hypothetical protein